MILPIDCMSDNFLVFINYGKSSYDEDEDGFDDDDDEDYEDDYDDDEYDDDDDDD